jgi:hypothetical protein
MVFEDFDLTLEPQDQGFLPTDELHWLVTGVKNQRAIEGGPWRPMFFAEFYFDFEGASSFSRCRYLQCSSRIESNFKVQFCDPHLSSRRTALFTRETYFRSGWIGLRRASGGAFRAGSLYVEVSRYAQNAT